MKKLLRALTVLMAAGVLMFTSAGVALAAAVVSSGMMTISVEDRSADGVNLYIPIPAALIEAAAGGAQLLIPERELAKVRRAVGPWQESVGGVLDKLADAPDGVLVAVDSKTERVRIEKRGRNLEIEVHDHESDVSISVPLPSVARLLASFS